MKRISSLGLGLLVAAASLGQTTPATTSAPVAPEFMLDYHDVPADQVMQETAAKFNLMIMHPPGGVNARLTVGSDGPVSAADAVLLLNQALWPFGYRFQGQLPGSPAPDVPVPASVGIGMRPTTKQPAEMRVWRRGMLAVPGIKNPAEIPGIAADKTMELKYTDAPLSEILKDMGDRFGFQVELSKELKNPVTLLSPEPVTAVEAVELMNDLLNIKGLGLKVVVGDKQAKLQIVEIPPDPQNEGKTVALDFADAPLDDVLVRLGRLSGFGIKDDVKQARVTLHEKLKVDASGLSDVGPIVAMLNEQLEKQGVVIEESRRADGNGGYEPILMAWPIDEAKKNLVDSAQHLLARSFMAGNWPGVDMKKEIKFVFHDASVAEILAECSTQFGFVIVDNDFSRSRVSITVPQTVNAVQAAKLLGSILNATAMEGVDQPTASGKQTMIHVVTIADANRFWKANEPETQKSPPTSKP